MRTINKINLIMIGAIIFVYSICTAKDIINSSTNINIILKANAPFSEALVSIDNNGEIKYKEISRGDGKPCSSYIKNISRKNVEELAKFISEKGFFELTTIYMEKDIMDLSTYVITVTVNDRTKSISYYGFSSLDGRNSAISEYWGSEVPTVLYEIKDKIEEILGIGILEIGI